MSSMLYKANIWSVYRFNAEKREKHIQNQNRSNTSSNENSRSLLCLVLLRKMAYKNAWIHKIPNLRSWSNRGRRGFFGRWNGLGLRHCGLTSTKVSLMRGRQVYTSVSQGRMMLCVPVNEEKRNTTFYSSWRCLVLYFLINNYREKGLLLVNRRYLKQN